MTDAEILDRLAGFVRTTFVGADNVEVTAATTADDVPGWDSLTHALFLMNVERGFGLEFEPMDVLELENIGELAGLIARLRTDGSRQ